MAEVETIFDLFTLYGPIPQRSDRPTADDLRQSLGKQKVAGAVTVSTRAVYYDAPEGNRETVRTLASTPPGTILFPAAVLDPRRGTFQAADISGAKMIYILPATQGWPLPYAPLTTMMGALPNNIPVLWEVRRQGEATRAAFTLKEIGYTGAPVLLAGVTGDTLAEALAAAKTSDRIGLTTLGLRGIGELAYAVATLGAARVFYASGAPLDSLAASVALMKLSGLGTEDRIKVFGGNAQRLLGVSVPPIS